MSDNEDKEPTNATESANGEEQNEVTEEQNTNENQSEEVTAADDAQEGEDAGAETAAGEEEKEEAAADDTAAGEEEKDEAGGEDGEQAQAAETSVKDEDEEQNENEEVADSEQQETEEASEIAQTEDGVNAAEETEEVETEETQEVDDGQKEEEEDVPLLVNAAEETEEVEAEETQEVDDGQKEEEEDEQQQSVAKEGEKEDTQEQEEAEERDADNDEQTDEAQAEEEQKEDENEAEEETEEQQQQEDSTVESTKDEVEKEGEEKVEGEEEAQEDEKEMAADEAQEENVQEAQQETEGEEEAQGATEETDGEEEAQEVTEEQGASEEKESKEEEQEAVDQEEKEDKDGADEQQEQAVQEAAGVEETDRQGGDDDDGGVADTQAQQEEETTVTAQDEEALQDEGQEETEQTGGSTREVTEDDTLAEEQKEATPDVTNEQQAEEAPAQAEGGEVQIEVSPSEEVATTQEQSDMNENAVKLPGSPREEVPSPPHLPGQENSTLSLEGQMSTSALNIVWSFGLNRNVPVLNLSDGVRQAIMYPCAHVGIMYDFKNNKQHSLQAHLNPITCSAVSQDKRWLVTGDVGPDAMVNIWDTYTGTPIQTMFDPNPQGGVVAVALTPDSRYLATLSALPVQTLAIWDWTVDGDVPICSADLKPEYGLQNFIYFDPTDIHHVVTNSETQVLFYNWEDGKIKYFAPPLSDTDFNKPVGRYSQSLFQIGIARALTATSIGNLVVWDNNRPLSKIMDVNQSADKKPLKIIKVHDKGINVLTLTETYIVIGDTAGHVKFYDQGLRLIYWYQDFMSGPCTAISFAHMPDFTPVAHESSKYPSDATKQAKPFVVRDFIVGTAIAVYCNINTDGSKLRVIHREHDAAVHALAAHPKLPIIAMGSYSGLLKLWNYKTKEVVASRMFEKYHIQSCTFDVKGFCLAVGCTNGHLFLLDSVALLDTVPEGFKYARDAITHIAFSHNSQYMATADAGFTITVYKRQRKEGRNPYTWHGRYRSHYKPIKDLIFDVYLDTNEPKLLSLGEDRMLIEYDLYHSGKTNNKIVPCAQDRIEQAAIPQCMTKYPPITKEHFFLTANDQYKLKCYNSTTKMCRKTVLGPTYGSPIRKMMVVPTIGPEDKNRFLAYVTDDKVGLHFLPATGNPHLAMALIAHPSGVSNLACSFDGTYLFTAGGPDFAVHMWEINITALEAQAKLGGEDLVPFYGLLEGGRDGDLFAELEDLFYYAQLRHQGINCMEQREIGNRVPIAEVPFIMRAMGFYPSEQEIEDMLNEIKYDEYVTLGHYQEDIDLGRFIKLYVNHRPAFGLSPEKLLWAFQTLTDTADSNAMPMIERGDFLDMLQKNGEHMTEYELAEHLTTLLGFNQEGGACEQEEFEAEKAGTLIADALPYDINADILINEILGFSMTVDPPAPDDTKDVIKSGAS